MKSIFMTLVVGVVVHITLCCVAWPTAAAEKDVVLNFAHGGSIDHVYQVGAKEFARLVAIKTGGKLQIRIFPNGELGSEGEAGEGVRLGVTDIAVIAAAGVLAQWIPKIQVFDLPYLFKNRGHAHKVLDGPVGTELNEEIEKIGVKNLAYWEIGTRHLTNNQRPILTPEDLRGLRMRVMSVKVSIKIAQSLGAIALPIAFEELYAAFQHGIVDGQDNPLATIKSMRYYEVQKYLSLTSQTYSPALVIMNAERFKQLPGSFRDALKQAAVEAAVLQRQFIENSEQGNLQFLKEKGMMVNNPDIEPFKKATKIVYQEMHNEIPLDLVKRIQSIH